MEGDKNTSDFVRCGGLYVTYYFKNPAQGKYLVITVLVIITNIALSLVGSVANAMILASYFRNKGLRSKHTLLLCILASTDFIITAVVQPLFVATKFSDALATFNPCLLWSINSLLSFICLGMSMFCLIFLSLERFAILHYPYRYKLIVTRSRIAAAMCIAGFAVLGIACLHVLLRVREVTFLFYSVLSLCSIIACVSLGVWIQKLLRHHRKEIKRNETVEVTKAQMKLRMKAARSTTTSFLIAATLIACYIPKMIMLIYEGFYEISHPQYYIILRPSFLTLAYVNSALDPCLLLWRNRDIRNTASHIFDMSRRSTSTAI